MENNIEKYYYISHCINCEPVILHRYNCDSQSKYHIRTGNVYKTKKEAEKALEKYKLDYLNEHKTLVKVGD